MAEQVDVVVIGTGPGGETLVAELARAGLDVVAVEKELVGGECPYWGCIPSKMMIRGADLLAEARRVEGTAGSASVQPDFRQVAARIRDEATANWDDTAAVDRLTDAGARLVRGTAQLSGPREVTVEGQVFEARRGVVLNVGTVPSIPPVDGLADTPYWTNRHALEATERPESLVVIGGGAIGLELAQAFARFGSEVTVVEGGDRVMALEEPEASALVAKALANDGLNVRTGAKVESVRHDGAFTVVVDGDELTAERVLVATGRRPDFSGLGLDSVGLDPQVKALETDERMQVTDGLWAIGDVTGKGAFTHVSMYQARIARRAILGEDGPWARYHAVPRVTFTDPEVGVVGLTEAQAREQLSEVRSGFTDGLATRGWIHGPGGDGFIKLVEDAQRGVLVGATSVGPTGGEVLSALAVAVHARVPTADLAEMIYAYPTFHRAIGDALANLA